MPVVCVDGARLCAVGWSQKAPTNTQPFYAGLRLVAIDGDNFEVPREDEEANVK